MSITIMPQTMLRSILLVSFLSMFTFQNPMDTWMETESRTWSKGSQITTNNRFGGHHFISIRLITWFLLSNIFWFLTRTSCCQSWFLLELWSIYSLPGWHSTLANKEMMAQKTAADPTTEKMVAVFHPVLVNLEKSVQNVALSQVELRAQLDSLLIELTTIRARVEDGKMGQILEEKSKKLLALKRRLTLVHTILQNSNERCRKLMSSNSIDPVS